MSDYIPNELLVDILVRLPVASLLRFKSVCKSWNSLITNPSFVTKHLNHSKTNSEKILLGLYIGEDRKRYLLCRDNERFGDELSELKLPFVIQFDLALQYFRIVGSLNCILCLQLYLSREKSKIILWNPSTRKSVIVPIPKPEEGLCGSVLGFGLHPATHEYNLIMIEYDKPTHLGIGTKVEIYTQATGWRGIVSNFPSYYIVDYEEAQAFVNGTINWIGTTNHSVLDCDRNTIVSFDMSAETFSILMLPPTLANEHCSLIVKVFQGSLAVLCHDCHPQDTDICMWVMKEYGVPESWTKLFSLDSDMSFCYGALGFRKHGEVLLWTSSGQLVSYDIRTKALTDTGIRGSAVAYFVELFLETLVSLENQNGVFDEQLNPM